MNKTCVRLHYTTRLLAIYQILGYQVSSSYQVTSSLLVTTPLATMLLAIYLLLCSQLVHYWLSTNCTIMQLAFYKPLCYQLSTIYYDISFHSISYLLVTMPSPSMLLAIYKLLSHQLSTITQHRVASFITISQCLATYLLAIGLQDTMALIATLLAIQQLGHQS